MKSIDLWEARPKFNLWTSGKHVQDSNPSDLWEACPNFNPLDLWEVCPNFKSMDFWEARLKLQIHQTIGKHVLYLFFFFKKKKEKKKKKGGGGLHA